jgi:hypothetical protein
MQAKCNCCRHAVTSAHRLDPAAVTTKSGALFPSISPTTRVIEAFEKSCHSLRSVSVIALQSPINSTGAGQRSFLTLAKERVNEDEKHHIRAEFIGFDDGGPRGI